MFRFAVLVARAFHRAVLTAASALLPSALLPSALLPSALLSSAGVAARDGARR